MYKRSVPKGHKNAQAEGEKETHLILVHKQHSIVDWLVSH
jgi:hypothetical protein